MMDDFLGLSLHDGYIDRREDQFGVQVRRHRPYDDCSVEGIYHDGEAQKV